MGAAGGEGDRREEQGVREDREAERGGEREVRLDRALREAFAVPVDRAFLERLAPGLASERRRIVAEGGAVARDASAVATPARAIGATRARAAGAAAAAAVVVAALGVASTLDRERRPGAPIEPAFVARGSSGEPGGLDRPDLADVTKPASGAGTSEANGRNREPALLARDSASESAQIEPREHASRLLREVLAGSEAVLLRAVNFEIDSDEEQAAAELALLREQIGGSGLLAAIAASREEAAAAGTAAEASGRAGGNGGGDEAVVQDHLRRLEAVIVRLENAEADPADMALLAEAIREDGLLLETQDLRRGHP